MKSAALIFLLCLLAVDARAQSAACSRKSPANTVALVELYTSEGCDSCPPADRFFSGLKNSLPAGQFVPLSLHVDYWDYIGWKDTFAQAAFTVRQRWQAGLAQTKAVYTPELFVAGRELRDWRGDVGATVAKVNSRPAQAQIAIALGKQAGGALPVEVTANAAQSGKLFVALYENDLTSMVKAGENKGSTLKHDYVVREWIGPLALAADGAHDSMKNSVKFSRAVNLPAGAVARNLGVAAFVQTEKGEVLQALALPACGS